MNWLLLLFIILLIGMFTYPLIMLVPTPREKVRIALRQAAMSKGIKIEVRRPVLPEKLKNPYDHLGKAVGYGLPAQNYLLKQKHTALRNPDTDEWFWLDGCRPPAHIMQTLLDIYSQLPDYCLAVEQSRDGSMIFLVENFSTEQLDAIHTSLTKLNDAIRK